MVLMMYNNKTITRERHHIMKRNILIISIVLLVVGFVTARVGDSLSTVTESGKVLDSALMPIGAILFILGLLTIAVAIIWYLADFIGNRLKKD
jgi:uncharacterized membrane protein YidH (DUF202 family)